MANTYVQSTRLWKLDTVGEVVPAGVVIIESVIYFPSSVNDDLVLQDAPGNDAIILKAGASDISPIRWPSEPGGLRLNGLKVATIDGGVAHVRIL